jgi:hypothetical protein
MTTYGPTSFSLRDRLAAADAVLRIDRAELLDTSIDDLAAERRELGYFELHVAGILAGQATESIRVVVARGRDGTWPIPTDTRFVALVQEAGRQGDWTLVHNSAFALDRAGFRFSPTIGCDGARQPGERVTLRELSRTIAEIAKEREARARALDAHEPDAKKGRWFGEMEMPDARLASLQGHETGGVAGKPDGGARSRRMTPKG